MSIRIRMKMMVPFCSIFMAIFFISFYAKLNNLDLKLASKQRISDVNINQVKKQIKSVRSQINCDEDQISCGKNRTASWNFSDIKISVVKQPELLKQRCGDLCASTVKTNKWNFLNFVTSEVKHYFKLYYKNTFVKY